MKKLYKDQLEIIVRQLDELEKQHLKADVFFNIDAMGVEVIYPLPANFYRLDELMGKSELKK